MAAMYEFLQALTASEACFFSRYPHCRSAGLNWIVTQTT